MRSAQTARPDQASKSAGGWARLQPWLGTAARVLLASVWLYAGIDKARDPGQFVVAVKAYQLLPDGLAHVVAYALPIGEIGVGLLLLAGLATRFAAAASALLLTAFIIGVASAAARGLSIDCGCFGGGGAVQPGQTTYTVELLRDAGLLVAAAFLIGFPRSRYAADDAVRASVVATRVDLASRRTQEARERALAVLERQRADLRRRTRLVAVVAAVALVGVAAVGGAVQAKRDAPGPAVGTVNYTGPVSAAGTDGIVVGYPDAPVAVDVYEDFMCPICGHFEETSGATLLQLARDHRATLRYHMLNFLDPLSNNTRYSTRAANAAACSADLGAPFVQFHSLLYANQPKEHSPGLSDDELTKYGVQSGAPADTFGGCVRDRTHASWPDQQNAAAAQIPGFQGTPTVRIGNQDIDWQSVQNIVDAVNAAASAPK
ncbi:MAG: thioredoxin domain-containing protein [Actinobacteria bacterium]|nr:thioredoxin domain-containing protein [Actinomycetota bacterium]MBI3686104.1 thioredoxin domain-containing protein [Actinomycetota bacterium]